MLWITKAQERIKTNSWVKNYGGLLSIKHRMRLKKYLTYRWGHAGRISRRYITVCHILSASGVCCWQTGCKVWDNMLVLMVALWKPIWGRVPKKELKEKHLEKIASFTLTSTSAPAYVLSFHLYFQTLCWVEGIFRCKDVVLTATQTLLLQYGLVFLFKILS